MALVKRKSLPPEDCAWNAPDYCGWLEVQRTGFWHRSWATRFLVLKGSTLFVLKRVESKYPVTIVVLKKAKVSPVSVTGSEVDSAWRNLLEIKLASAKGTPRKTLLISATSSQDQSDWFEALAVAAGLLPSVGALHHTEEMKFRPLQAGARAMAERWDTQEECRIAWTLVADHPAGCLLDLCNQSAPGDLQRVVVANQALDPSFTNLDTLVDQPADELHPAAISDICESAQRESFENTILGDTRGEDMEGCKIINMHLSQSEAATCDTEENKVEVSPSSVSTSSETSVRSRPRRLTGNPPLQEQPPVAAALIIPAVIRSISTAEEMGVTPTPNLAAPVTPQRKCLSGVQPRQPTIIVPHTLRERMTGERAGRPIIILPARVGERRPPPAQQNTLTQWGEIRACNPVEIVTAIDTVTDEYPAEWRTTPEPPNTHSAFQHGKYHPDALQGGLTTSRVAVSDSESKPSSVSMAEEMSLDTGSLPSTPQQRKRRPSVQDSPTSPALSPIKEPDAEIVPEPPLGLSTPQPPRSKMYATPPAMTTRFSSYGSENGYIKKMTAPHSQV